MPALCGRPEQSCTLCLHRLLLLAEECPHMESSLSSVSAVPTLTLSRCFLCTPCHTMSHHVTSCWVRAGTEASTPLTGLLLPLGTASAGVHSCPHFLLQKITPRTGARSLLLKDRHPHKPYHHHLGSEFTQSHPRVPQHAEAPSRQVFLHCLAILALTLPCCCLEHILPYLHPAPPSPQAHASRLGPP